MLLFEFQKTGPYVYVPHVDMLRAVTRTLRRARIECAYSRGFNPHILLYFSPPLPIGVRSVCEQCALDCRLSADEFLDRYNRAAPAGLKASRAHVFPYPVNPASAVKKAAYEIELRADGFPGFSAAEVFAKLTAAIGEILAGNSFGVETGRADGKRVKEARPLIHGIEANKGSGVPAVRAVLSAGQENLRADRFIEALLARAGLPYAGADITRAALYNG